MFSTGLPRKTPEQTYCLVYIQALSGKQTFNKDNHDRLPWLPETTNDFRRYSAHVRDAR